MSTTPNIDILLADPEYRLLYGDKRLPVLLWDGDHSTGATLDLGALTAEVRVLRDRAAGLKLRHYTSDSGSGYVYRCREGMIEVRGELASAWVRTASIQVCDAEGIARLRAHPYRTISDVRHAVWELVQGIRQGGPVLDAAVTEIIALVRTERA